MRVKIQHLLAILLVVLLSALLAIDTQVQQSGITNLLLTTPKTSNVLIGGLRAIEDLSAEKFMLTYEILAPATVKAVNGNYAVTLVKTNDVYPFVLPCRILSGAFFTVQAREEEKRHMVLNKAAAFALFKTMDIAGNEVILDQQSYLVVGVLDDGDENLRAYLPATIGEDLRPTAFMSVLAEEKGSSAELVKNEFKHLGLTEMDYDFINLALVSTLLRDRSFIALASTASAFLLLLLFKRLSLFRTQLRLLRDLDKQFYFKELVMKHPRTLFDALGFPLLLLAIGAALLALAPAILEKSLRQYHYAGVFDNIRTEWFAAPVKSLLDFLLYSNVLFTAFFLTLVAFFSISSKQIGLGGPKKNG